MANTGRQVCIINSFHSFLVNNMKLCTVVADILNMWTCLFGKKKHFDKITAFSNLENFWLCLIQDDNFV